MIKRNDSQHRGNKNEKLLIPLVVKMMVLPATAAAVKSMISSVVSWKNNFYLGMEFSMDYSHGTLQTKLRLFYP